MYQCVFVCIYINLFTYVYGSIRFITIPCPDQHNWEWPLIHALTSRGLQLGSLCSSRVDFVRGLLKTYIWFYIQWYVHICTYIYMWLYVCVFLYISIYRYHIIEVFISTFASYSSFLPAKISIFNLPGNQEQGHHWRDSGVGGPYNRWCLEGSDSELVVLKIPSYCWWFRHPANHLRLVVEIPLFTGF